MAGGEGKALEEEEEEEEDDEDEDERPSFGNSILIDGEQPVKTLPRPAYDGDTRSRS